LGALVFATLAGRPPFEGEDADAVAGQQITALPPSLRSLREDVPVALDRVVLATLAKDPADRPDAAELRAALDLWCATDFERPGAARPGPPVPSRREDAATPALVLAPPVTRPAAGVVIVVPAPVARPGPESVGGGTARGVPRAERRSPAPHNARHAGVVLVCVLALCALGVAGHLSFATDAPAVRSPALPRAAASATGRAPSASRVAVPVVVGLARDVAAARLEAAGLVVRATTKRDSRARAGVVIGVEPAEGRSLPRGTVVGLVVASGETTVPDVVGGSLTDALATLSRRGLAVTWRRVSPNGDRVSRMMPGPGSLVAQGSSIQLEVGGGAPVAPAPSASEASATPTLTPSPQMSSATPDASGPPSPSPSVGTTASPTSTP
jgi:serine/threonine-protein kinase